MKEGMLLSDFFEMYAETCCEQYVVLPDALRQAFSRGCLWSELQFLDREPVSFEVSDEGGTEFPDFLTHDSICLISGRFRDILTEAGADYLFFKPVKLTIAELGKHRQYFLMIVPRINCLDIERSRLLADEDDTLPLWLRPREGEKIVIMPQSIGRFAIFKLAGVLNQEIVVTEQLKQIIEAAGCSNVYFNKIQEGY